MRLTLWGAPIEPMTDADVQRWLDRAIECAADAQRYSPSENMYRDEVRKAAAELERRRAKAKG